MIRPLTVATFLLACGSGLYLYQSKHEVQLLDRTIERTVHETGALREQSRLLAAEWTMLNDPERLRQFSDTYLSLKTITPSQFTSLADLGNRMPAPRIEAPAPGVDEQESLPLAADAVPQASEPAGSTIQVLPVPPMPAPPPTPIVASTTHQTDARTASSRPPVGDSQPRLAASEARQAEQHATRMADARSEVRPPAAPPPAILSSAIQAPVVQASIVPPPRPIVLAAPRPIILAAPRPLPVNTRAPASPQVTQSSTLAPVSAPAPVPVPSRPTMVASSMPYAGTPYTGSLLGMAHGSGSVPPPVPRPAPLNATYRSN